jgi:hypothetical protein
MDYIIIAALYPLYERHVGLDISDLYEAMVNPRDAKRFAMLFQRLLITAADHSKLLDLKGWSAAQRRDLLSLSAKLTKATREGYDYYARLN